MRSEKEAPEADRPEPGQGNEVFNFIHHDPLQKSRLNRRQAIRARCLDCSGFSAKKVRECPLTDCPMYPYRLLKGKQDPRARDKAIRAYCLWCMNGQKKEVGLCPSDVCPLFQYRHTKAKKVNIGQTSRRKNLTEGDRPGGGHGEE